jgi:hypothetical protein
MEENEKNNKSGAQRDVRGLKEVRPAAPVKTVASNPHFKVSHHIVYSIHLLGIISYFIFCRFPRGG